VASPSCIFFFPIFVLSLSNIFTLGIELKFRVIIAPPPFCLRGLLFGFTVQCRGKFFSPFLGPPLLVVFGGNVVFGQGKCGLFPHERTRFVFLSPSPYISLIPSFRYSSLVTLPTIFSFLWSLADAFFSDLNFFRFRLAFCSPPWFYQTTCPSAAFPLFSGRPLLGRLSFPAIFLFSIGHATSIYRAVFHALFFFRPVFRLRGPFFFFFLLTTKS